MNTNKQTESEKALKQEEQPSKKPTTSSNKEENNKEIQKMKERQMRAKAYEAEYLKKLQDSN